MATSKARSFLQGLRTVKPLGIHQTLNHSARSGLIGSSVICLPVSVESLQYRMLRSSRNFSQRSGTAFAGRWFSTKNSKGANPDQSGAQDPSPCGETGDVSKSDLELAFDASAEPDAEIPGAKSGGKKLAIVFTCTVCETRSAKRFTENSYLNGVVLVRCPGCKNLHLIADRLGFFTDDEGGWDIEKAIKGRDDIKVVTNDTVLELTMADVLGGPLLQQATTIQQGQQQSSHDTSSDQKGRSHESNGSPAEGRENT